MDTEELEEIQDKSICEIALTLLQVHWKPTLSDMRRRVAMLVRTNRELKQILNERHERRPFKVRHYRIEERDVE